MALALSGCASHGVDTVSATDVEANGFVSTDADNGKSVAGFVNGGLIDRSLGDGLDRALKRQALEAEYRALETGATGEIVAWGGDKSVPSGRVVAAQPYRVGSQDCRQYTQFVDSSSGERRARGTACRNSDGSWALLN